MAIRTISTARLTVRNWKVADANAFHAIWGDPEVIWWGHSRSSRQSLAILEDIIERTRPPGVGWCAVELRSEDRIVGNVCLQPAPQPRDDIEIGWHFLPSERGNGYATEAAAALVRHGFDYGWPRIVADILPTNTASQAVAARLGMERTTMVDRGGLIHDVWAITPQS